MKPDNSNQISLQISGENKLYQISTVQADTFHKRGLHCFASKVVFPTQPELDVRINGSWSSGPEEDAAIINDGTLTFGNGDVAKLQIKSSSSFEMEYEGKTYTCELRDDDRLHWSEGEIWIRFESAPSASSTAKLESQSSDVSALRVELAMLKNKLAGLSGQELDLKDCCGTRFSVF